MTPSAHALTEHGSAPKLVELVRNGTIDPAEILTQREPMTAVLDAYRAFDARSPGWIEVELRPGS